MKQGADVSIENLTKKFGSFSVINGLNCEIKSGESVVILGGSGEGKSVTMSMIGTLMDPTSGSIKIDGREITGLSKKGKEKVMQKIGFMFQSPGLFDHLTVWENVAFREIYVEKMDTKRARDLAIEKLVQMDIKEEAFDLKPSDISGGMQKRVAMARTVMKKPMLLLLDEPTSGLDPVMSDRINKVIKTTRDILNPTIITITHDLNSALQVADRIFFLKGGKFIWSGNAVDILSSDNEYIQRFVNSANIKS